jgi:hypothetical protein
VSSPDSQVLAGTGARPKRSSLKNWPQLPQLQQLPQPTPPKVRMTHFHQQSLDDALEMRNLTVEEEEEFAQVLSGSILGSSQMHKLNFFK